MWNPITYRDPPRLPVPSAWHVVPVAKVTHRSWWPPRGTGVRSQLGALWWWKGWMRNGSLLQAQWPERVILFLSALQLHLYLILTGLYPRAQVRSFTYTTRHVSHPQPHAQHKPCKRHSLTPAYRLTPTSEGLLFLLCMHAFWWHHFMRARVGNTTKILFHYMRNLSHDNNIYQ